MPKAVFSAIRHLSSPYDGPRIAGAEPEYTVYVWDLKTRKRVSVFDSPLDLGGRRLAINPRGDMCAVASYTLGGLACYASDTGEVICIRDDLKKLQLVSYSPDGKRLYCGHATGPLTVLDAETGADLARYRSTENVYSSPFQPLELLEMRGKGPHELRDFAGNRIAKIARTTFAILDAAFGPDRLCISESGGPVRCLDTKNGTELWRYTPKPGRHFLTLAYSPKSAAFHGVEWSYMKGGKKRLVRLDAALGKPTLVATFSDSSATEVFCSRGEALLTSEGQFIDVNTGLTSKSLRFPKMTP